MILQPGHFVSDFLKFVALVVFFAFMFGAMSVALVVFVFGG